MSAQVAASMRGGERISAAIDASRGADGPPALIPYLTAGFPTLEALPDLLAAAQAGGAAVIEVGLPFSDPLADGPTIQAASQAALDNGMSVGLALEQVATARAAGMDIPVAAMTYFNPVLAYGVDRFCADAAEIGIEGLIVPDLPWDESEDLRLTASKSGLAVIPLVTPLTVDDRLREACAAAEGFVYCVAVVGVTGARRELAAESLDLLERVRGLTSAPRALGFGISERSHVDALRGRADAVVVASALLDAVGRDLGAPAETVERFLRRLRPSAA